MTPSDKTVSLSVLILILPTVIVTPADGRNHIKDFKMHLKRVTDMAKREPQPRIVEVQHELELKPSEIFYPQRTLLHRCDTVACCGVSWSPGSVCQPSSQEVMLYFQAVDHITFKKRIIKQPFQNHTACTCLKI